MQGLRKKSSRSLLDVNEGGFFERNEAVARYMRFLKEDVAVVKDLSHTMCCTITLGKV